MFSYYFGLLLEHLASSCFTTKQPSVEERQRLCSLLVSWPSGAAARRQAAFSIRRPTEQILSYEALISNGRWFVGFKSAKEDYSHLALKQQCVKYERCMLGLQNALSSHSRIVLKLYEGIVSVTSHAAEVSLFVADQHGDPHERDPLAM